MQSRACHPLLTHPHSLCRVLFSTGNPTNYYNPIQDVRINVYLDTQEGTFPVYEAGARRRIDFYKPAENDFLAQFDVHEIQLVCCFSDADSIWQVRGVLEH